MKVTNPILPQIVVAISYDDIYSDYDKVNPEDFIKDIPTIPLLKYVIERFNKVLYVSPLDKRNLSLLWEFNSKLPKGTRNKVFKLTKLQNDKVHIYTHDGVTLFTQLALQNYVPLKCEEDNYIADDEYEKIFKALLYCNQIWTDNQLSSNEAKTPHLIDMSILIDLPVIEFKGGKDFKFQLFKAIRFFEFCETDTTFKSYLPYFYNDKKVNSWNEYIYKLFKYFEQSLKSVVFNIDSTFIKQFIIDLNDDEISTIWSNYKKGMQYLRNKFFFPISDDQCLLLNANLLVDKIYQGVKFDLYNVVKKNSLLTPSAKKYKDFPNFNSILGDLYSETSLLYHLLEKTFANKNRILFSGINLKPYWIDGEPDYYIRQDDSIFLFEHKDLILGDNIKYSRDIEKIKEEIRNRLCFDDETSRKGVGQLLFSINRIINEGIMDEIDPGVQKVKFIFPIITVTDSAFSAMGVNAIVTESYIKLLQKYHFDKRIFISTPIIIDYDNILYLSYRLNNGLDLKKLLLEYVYRKKGRLESFSMFIYDKYSHAPKYSQSEIRYMFPEFPES